MYLKLHFSLIRLYKLYNIRHHTDTGGVPLRGCAVGDVCTEKQHRFTFWTKRLRWMINVHEEDFFFQHAWTKQHFRINLINHYSSPASIALHQVRPKCDAWTHPNRLKVAKMNKIQFQFLLQTSGAPEVERTNGSHPGVSKEAFSPTGFSSLTSNFRLLSLLVRFSLSAVNSYCSLVSNPLVESGVILVA